MKSITLFFLVAIFLSFGCAPPASESTAVDLESERDALMAVDKAWSESIDDTDAFLSFIAEDAYFMPFGAPLARGDAIRTTWEGLASMPGFDLHWQATTAEHDGTAMLTEGKYVTVWHKQADGSWKMQVDCFNANGPPTAADG